LCCRSLYRQGFPTYGQPGDYYLAVQQEMH
jgi:hypothetical protein